MRLNRWLLAAGLAVGFTPLASAQTSSAFTGGVSPSSIVSKPIDVTHAIAPPNVLMSTASRFSVSALFRRLPGLSWPPSLGVSNYPAPSSYPRYRDAIYPVQPIIPKQ